MKLDKEEEKEVWRRIVGISCHFLEGDRCVIRNKVCCYYCEDYKECTTKWVKGNYPTYCRKDRRKAWCSTALIQRRREMEVEGEK